MARCDGEETAEQLRLGGDLPNLKTKSVSTHMMLFCQFPRATRNVRECYIHHKPVASAGDQGLLKVAPKYIGKDGARWKLCFVNMSP